MKKKWNWRKWCDEWILAGKGILLATKEKRFLVGFFVSFVVFSVLMNLLANGMGTFQLMWATGFSGTMKILGDAFLAVFGIGKNFLEWLPIFAIAVLQGVLIGLIALMWGKRVGTAGAKGGKSVKNHTKSAEKVSETTQNAENVQKAGIITGLIALGAGCPTCGTTLITPLIGTFVSTGSLAVAGVISTIVTWLAIVIALLSLHRLGVETYAIIINERYLKRHGRSDRK